LRHREERIISETENGDPILTPINIDPRYKLGNAAMGIHHRRDFLKHCAGAGVALGAPRLGPGATEGIKVGCCVKLKELQAVIDAGFQYIEPGAAELAELTPDEFQAVKEKVMASPIRCDAFNSFIRRKDLAVVGPNVNLPAVKEYVDSALERCRQMGASIVVWGSAGSRNVPAGFPREKAWEQMAVFLEAIAPIAGRHKIVISLEPLNHKESNILNTGAETLKLVKQVNRAPIQMIIDYYHLRMENEPVSIMEEGRGHINHLHFAYPVGRLWPTLTTVDPVYGEFFAMLKKLRWTGGISVEGRGTPEANGQAAMAFFRKELGNSLRG
jgi:sugar phosphate isomerase/epimerase